MIRILFIKNDYEFSGEVVEKLCEGLLQKDRDKAFRFRRWQDKQASLLGKYLLKCYINNQNHDPALIKEINYNPNGKPFINNVPFSFNISHSGKYVVCAIDTLGNDIGIDIEEIKKIDINDFKLAFSNDEINNINSSENSEAEFFRRWTIKETVLKTSGKGITSISDLNSDITENYILLDSVKFYLKEISIDDYYSCHCSSVFPIQDIQVQELLDTCFKAC
ncbi:MAG: 4-phosphopantetheinyl transferase [Bacteroidetes bacterium]|jgi:4'-phosphopantetheinyl transferase|nr:4-phosphopantetheinyl transferase [Bacteroidota bacterium]